MYRCDVFCGRQARAARQLLERIQSHSIDVRLEALKELAKLSADPTFATEFINMEGIGTLARLVDSGTQWVQVLIIMLFFFLHIDIKFYLQNTEFSETSLVNPRSAMRLFLLLPSALVKCLPSLSLPSWSSWIMASCPGTLSHSPSSNRYLTLVYGIISEHISTV